MVNPQWGNFQKPSDVKEMNYENKEFQKELPGKVLDEEMPEGNQPQWGNFQTPMTYQGEPDPTEDEGALEYIARNAVQLSSRAVEQVAGRYGNLEKFAKDALVNIPETGGIIGWAVSQLVGPEKWENIVRGNNDFQMLPTSQDFRNVSETLSGGFTKPKTKNEEKLSEFAEDVGATLSGRRPLSAVNNLLIPAAANATKQLVQETGFGEDKANMAKMAVWLPLSLAYNVNASQYASNLMNQGRQGLPQNLQMNVPRFTQRLNAIEQSPYLLSSDPRTALARQAIANLRNDVANGQTNSQSLFTMYDGVNAAKRNRGMFDMNRADQNFARRAIDEVRNAVRDEIMDVGANYPVPLQNWQDGVRAWSVIHRSNAIKNYVEQLANGPYAKVLSGPAAALFGVGGFGAFKAPLVAIPGSGAASAGYKIGKTLYRMWQDPNLANYYWNAISAATEENAPAFIKNYLNINKKLEKDDSSVASTKKVDKSNKK